MFGAIYAAEGSSPEALLAVAQEFSPRVDAGSRNVLGNGGYTNPAWR